MRVNFFANYQPRKFGIFRIDEIKVICENIKAP